MATTVKEELKIGESEADTYDSIEREINQPSKAEGTIEGEDIVLAVNSSKVDFDDDDWDECESDDDVSEIADAVFVANQPGK